MDHRLRLAQAINGPLLPVPPPSRLSLADLRETNWKMASENGKRKALNIADALLAEGWLPAIPGLEDARVASRTDLRADFVAVLRANEEQKAEGALVIPDWKIDQVVDALLEKIVEHDKLEQDVGQRTRDFIVRWWRDDEDLLAFMSDLSSLMLGVQRAARKATERATQERDEARAIVRDIYWMARRYADGRSTYAPSMYNEAISKAIDGEWLEESVLEPLKAREDHEPEWTSLEERLHAAEALVRDLRAQMRSEPCSTSPMMPSV